IVAPASRGSSAGGFPSADSSACTCGSFSLEYPRASSFPSLSTITAPTEYAPSADGHWCARSIASSIHLRSSSLLVIAGSSAGTWVDLSWATERRGRRTTAVPDAQSVLRQQVRHVWWRQRVSATLLAPCRVAGSGRRSGERRGRAGVCLPSATPTARMPAARMCCLLGRAAWRVLRAGG